MKALVLLVAAYLLGSVPFSYLIVRWLRRQDVRTVGSGNAGATNTLRAAGRGAALVVLLLDVGKGLAVVCAARRLGQPEAVQSLVAAAAVLGHVFPIYLGFRGGKGVATAAGAFLGFSPLAMALTVALFVVTLAWQRWVSLASVLAALAYPAFLYAVGAAGWAGAPGMPALVTCAAIATLVIWKHQGNLGRILRGEEPRVGEARRSGP